MKKLLSKTALLMIMGAVPGYAAISTNLDVTVVPAPSSGPASCSNGGSFGMTVSNANPTAGSTVSVSFACGNGGNYLAWRSTNGVVGPVYPTPTGGAASGAVGMRVPNVASDRSLSWNIELLTGADGGLVAVSDSSITVPKTYTEVLANALPASAGGDPFVPAHVITVCPSGCNFSSPQDAIDQAQGNGWDNVEITVQVAEYVFNNTGSGPGNNRNLLNVQSAPHMWIKGIVGASGTDGTAKPWIHGTDVNGASLIITGLGAGEVTIDNFEIGPFNAWSTKLDAPKTTLRNVYVRDSYQGMISSDGHHHNLIIHNSHFARHGSSQTHDLYTGSGDGTDALTIQNSVFEQSYQGHVIKTRAATSNLICDKIMGNADDVFNGSELVDCSEGRVCAPHNSLIVEGGGNPGWSEAQSFDGIGYGRDREMATLTNNQLDAQGSVFIDDAHQDFRMLGLYKPLSPSPPYTVRNNTFVFFDTSSMLIGNNPFVPNKDSSDNNNLVSAVVFGATWDGASSANIVADGTNHWYGGRGAAGLPAIGNYPLTFYDASFSGVMPAACTDPIGTVRTPAN